MTSSIELKHGPAGSSVVRVNEIFPTKSAVSGVNIAFKSFGLGEKTPETLALQVADVAAPPIDPTN